jgi:glycosyltransferase involved in cell wall biosynthesis
MDNIKNKAEISVIIPCYNSQKTICRAFKSIENQTLFPLEVIIVDDASTDNSIDLLQKIKQTSAINIKLIHLPSNKGAANARNVGWGESTQKYIAFLDADDAWHPMKLEVQYKYMQNNPEISMTGHDYKVVSDISNLNWHIYSKCINQVNKNMMLLRNPFVTPSVMIKREVNLRFEGKKRYMEDYLLWLQVAFEDYKIVKLDIPLVALFKPNYGHAGLSSHLWAMEKAELDIYYHLFNQNKIGFLKFLFLLVFSLIKFIKRLLVVHVRKLVNA